MVQRVVASGIPQLLALDVAAGAGVVLIGVGIWQLAPAGATIYAGVVLLVGSVLVAAARDRERQPRRPSAPGAAGEE